MVRKAALVGLAVLFGCDQADDRVCSPYPPRIMYNNPTKPGEIASNAHSCVLHWAARLSLSNERADIAADAAIGACRGALTDYAMSVDPAPIVEREKSLREEALFRIVQQRAGKCGVPDEKGMTD